MSGGERKKRTSRGQGWEEAGAEFYQESYPADVDLEVLQRDPSHIATLLPSIQSRAGMHVPANYIRIELCGSCMVNILHHIFSSGMPSGTIKLLYL
jgi:hypothetical protein